jgi:hypothetical protein
MKIYTYMRDQLKSKVVPAEVQNGLPRKDFSFG